MAPKKSKPNNSPTKVFQVRSYETWIMCNARKETTILKNALSVIRLEHNLRLYYKHVLHRATAHVRTKSGSGPTLHYPLPNKVRG